MFGAGYLAAVAWGAWSKQSAGSACGETVAVPGKARAAKPTFRVALFNMRSGFRADFSRNLEAVRKGLEGFDVIALNEVAFDWGDRTDQAHVLSEELGLAALFAPTERLWGREHFGNALLTAVPIRRWCRLPLGGTSTHAYRNMTLAQIDLDGLSVQVLVTHVDVDVDADRLGQLRQVATLFHSLKAPCLVMGDFNSWRGDPAVAALFEGPGVQIVEPPFQASQVPKRCDWIVARGLTRVASSITELNVSDHPLVWAEFETPKPAGP